MRPPASHKGPPCRSVELTVATLDVESGSDWLILREGETNFTIPGLPGSIGRAYLRQVRLQMLGLISRSPFHKRPV